MARVRLRSYPANDGGRIACGRSYTFFASWRPKGRNAAHPRQRSFGFRRIARPVSPSRSPCYRRPTCNIRYRLRAFMFSAWRLMKQVNCAASTSTRSLYQLPHPVQKWAGFFVVLYCRTCFVMYLMSLSFVATRLCSKRPQRRLSGVPARQLAGNRISLRRFLEGVAPLGWLCMWHLLDQTKGG